MRPLYVWHDVWKCDLHAVGRRHFRSGGGGGGNNISQTAFVYFMDDTSAEMALEGLNVANSQTFAPIPTFVSPSFPVNTLGDNGGIAIVNKNFLYMPFANGSLYGFSIDAATGALSPVPNPILMLSGTGDVIAADPNGAVLFVGGSAGISTFTVNTNDGSLTPIGITPTVGLPTQITTDGTGKYVYALTGGTITAFTYTSNGVLGPVTGSPFLVTPGMVQIAGEASGKFLLGITPGAVDSHVYRILDRFRRRPDGLRFAGANSGPACVSGSESEWKVRLYLRPDFRRSDQCERTDGRFRVFDRNIDAIGNLALLGIGRERRQV